MNATNITSSCHTRFLVFFFFILQAFLDLSQKNSRDVSLLFVMAGSFIVTAPLFAYMSRGKDEVNS